MLRQLARLLLAGYCVAVVAQQTNVGALAFGDECRDNCPDDGDSHRCPLNCLSCSCVGHGIPVSLALVELTSVGRIVDRVTIDQPSKQPDPRPESIFHVPKPLAA